MESRDILAVGKISFWISFISANICLFGYIFTKIEDFASCGFVLLIFATPLNLLIIIILMIYGLIHKTYINHCIKASLIICINIPIAILYTIIGFNLLAR